MREALEQQERAIKVRAHKRMSRDLDQERARLIKNLKQMPAMRTAAHERPAHEALRNALEEALAEHLLPGPIRALAQTEVERAYGTLREQRPHRAHASKKIHHEEIFARDALMHFEAMLEAIERAEGQPPEAAAEACRNAAAAYTQSLAHLSEAQRIAVEHIIIEQQSAHAL